MDIWRSVQMRMSRNALNVLLAALCGVFAIGAIGCTSTSTVNNPPATVVVTSR